MDVVISSSFSCAFDYCTIYGVGGLKGSAATFPCGFPETCMDILQFGRGGGDVGMGVS